MSPLLQPVPEHDDAPAAAAPRAGQNLRVPQVDSAAEFGLYVSRRFAQCRRHGGKLALLWLEADVPAPDGPAAAPAAVLLTVGQRLRNRVREADEVVQVGHNCFAVLLIAAGPAEAQIVQRRLLPALRGTYSVEGRQLRIGMRVGAATYPEAGRTGADLAAAACAAVPAL